MLINKENLPLVVMDFMNDVHFEDVDIINELHEKILKYENAKTIENKEDLINTYDRWYVHTVNHFQGEEDEMLRLQFPPYMMHKGEHENCLYTMRNIIETFKSDDNIQALKNYIEVDLLNWLVNHIQTMDTVTAMFFKTGMSPCSAMH